jgi:hypothetical protein
MGTAGRTGAVVVVVVEVPDTVHNGAAEGEVGILQDKGWADNRPVNTLVL